MGADLQRTQREVAKPAPTPAAPLTTAQAPAVTVLCPQSLLGNSALKQQTAAAGVAPAQALLALQGAAGNLAVQRWAKNESGPPSLSRIHRAAQVGVTGPGERLPHRQAIQRSFGPAHDLSGVRAHVGGPAAGANAAMGATAFTTGEHVAFKAPPSLWLAAHEAAHVVQQRSGASLSGGVGHEGDPYERQADTVAGRVAAGRPAHDLLPGSGPAGPPALQRCDGVIHQGCECAQQAGGTTDETPTAVQRNGDGGFLEKAEGTLGGAVSTVPVQRQPAASPDQGTGATVTIPTSLTGADKDLVVGDRAEASTALMAVALGLEDRATALDDQGEASLRSMAKTTRTEAAKLTAPGPLSQSEAGYLNGFLTLATSTEQMAVEQAVGRFVAMFQTAKPTKEDQERIEHLEDDLAETLHQRYIGHQDDQIKKLVELTEKVKSWSDKVSEYSGKIGELSDKLEGVRKIATVAEQAKKLKEFTKDLGEKLDEAKEIGEIANDVATIAGVQGHPDGTAMMQAIDGFAAGIDLVNKTMDKFGKAVPLFNELWDKWYKPMVDACIKGLVKLAGLLEVQQREDAVAMWQVQQTDGTLKRDANGAPIIEPDYIRLNIFPGGQAVFAYLYCLREGRQPPPMSDDVKEYFLSRRDIMNEVDTDNQLTSDWRFLSPSTWSLKGRETNLVSWLAGHWGIVWSMLYGEYGRAVPH
jgi:hypothetical protein